MEQKEIRFIDSDYNELFRIPDGGKIKITFKDGSVTDRKCTYIDDYHTQIGYLFSGILICGCCGNRMTRKTVTYKGNKYFYYYCPTGKKNGCKIYENA